MKRKKLYRNETEWRFVVHALNKLRTCLLDEGQYTDVVDEAILKIVNAPVRKVRTAA